VAKTLLHALFPLVRAEVLRLLFTVDRFHARTSRVRVKDQTAQMRAG
jgi:hypothetical protein